MKPSQDTLRNIHYLLIEHGSQDDLQTYTSLLEQQRIIGVQLERGLVPLEMMKQIVEEIIKETV